MRISHALGPYVASIAAFSFLPSAPHHLRNDTMIDVPEGHVSLAEPSLFLGLFQLVQVGAIMKRRRCVFGRVDPADRLSRIPVEELSERCGFLASVAAQMYIPDSLLRSLYHFGRCLRDAQLTGKTATSRGNLGSSSSTRFAPFSSASINACAAAFSAGSSTCLS